MARLNEAYQVLSDPARRAVYDASVRDATTRPTAPRVDTAPARSTTTFTRQPPLPAQAATFPWRLCLVMAGIGAGIVLLIATLASQSPARPIDGVLEPGACVVLIETDRSAGEVPCDDSAAFRVSSLVSFGSACPSGTIGYRDRNGVGTACVERIPADE